MSAHHRGVPYPDHPAIPACTPAWTLATAAAAPAVLIGAATAVGMIRQSAYDPMGQTMSALASTGDSAWVMTAGFVASAVCQILTSAGLRGLKWAARAALAVAGCCGLAVAAFPSGPGTTAPAHLLATAAGLILLALWPVLAISTTGPAVCRVRVAIAATLVMSTLLAWVYYETQAGVDLGLAERFAVVGEMLWPLVVAISARHVKRGEA